MLPLLEQEEGRKAYELRESILSCERCELRADCKSPVPWSGPVKASILAFGEAPGEREDVTLRPFTGQAGRELDGYFWRAFLERDDIHVSNVVRCRPSGNHTPVADNIAACYGWTVAEIDLVQPDILLAMGATAIHALVGPHLTVAEAHGNVYEFNTGQRVIPVFCVTHPAAGLHNAREMKNIEDDFQAFHRYLTGQYTKIVDPLADFEEYKALTRGEVEELARDIELAAEWNPDMTIAADTEWTPDEKIWCMTLCMEPGKAYLIWPEDMEILGPILGRLGVTLHFAQADLNPLRDGGINLDPFKLGDTGVKAYILGIPQGLKYLAHRFCGMEMTDYMEIVGPIQDRFELQYLKDVLEKVEDSKKEKGDRRQTLHGKVKRALLDLSKWKPGDKPVDVKGRWANWDTEQTGPAEEVLGPWPAASLADAPPEVAIFYACRDADATKRVEIELDIELKAWNSFEGGNPNARV